MFFYEIRGKKWRKNGFCCFFHNLRTKMWNNIRIIDTKRISTFFKNWILLHNIYILLVYELIKSSKCYNYFHHPIRRLL